jgi:hypothetical protein
MPKMTVRSAFDVPTPVRSPKAVREAQMQYEEYVRAIDGDVGELELSPDEQPRGVKVRLRRAATRLGREIEIWDANGRVYFRVASKRGRPRKTAT